MCNTKNLTFYFEKAYTKINTQINIRIITQKSTHKTQQEGDRFLIISTMHLKFAVPKQCMINDCKSLDELWVQVRDLNKKRFPDNALAPIVGNGKTCKPKVMFVFINPTSRNISSDPSWQGPRFPFIGTKQVWRVFHKAGLFDDQLMAQINNQSAWSLAFTDQVLQFLRRNELYFTNIVKWTGQDATLPHAEKIKLFLPILEKEIELVQPEIIVTFGLIPFEKLAQQKIKLDDYYSEAMKTKKLKTYELKISSQPAEVIPCYFPVGRGNPKRAVEILNLLKNPQQNVYLEGLSEKLTL